MNDSKTTAKSLMPPCLMDRDIYDFKTIATNSMSLTKELFVSIIISDGRDDI